MTNTVLKPMLAEDWDEKNQKFPVIIQPKDDGVRGLTINGPLQGRSLKSHANKHTTALYTHPLLAGLDGELFIGDDPFRENLCSLTTGALNSITGSPRISWRVFDYWTPESMEWGYIGRLAMLQKQVALLKEELPQAKDIQVTESVMVKNMDELLEHEAKWCKMGSEGIIIRAPNGPIKQGRVTQREGWLLRVKRFIEEEALVIGVEQGQKNNNAAQINELGKQFRSAHKANKVPNGMVGALICRTLKDARDPHTGKVVIPADTIITVAPGAMTHKQAKHFWENQSEIMGKVIKYTFFPKGIKDKPRFPQFGSVRMASDI